MHITILPHRTRDYHLQFRMPILSLFRVPAMSRRALLLGSSSLALGLLVIARSLSTGAPTPVPEQMTAEKQAALLTVIRPCEGEDAFDKIAWLTAIHDAREKAAKDGKPILLWEMDGYPLGCG